MAYSKDKKLSFELLTRVSPAWGEQTALELSNEGKCRDFMSHVGVQELLSRIWCGQLDPDQPYLPLLCYTVPIITFLPVPLIRVQNCIYNFF